MVIVNCVPAWKPESKPIGPLPAASLRRLHGFANEDWVTECMREPAGNMKVTVSFTAAVIVLGVNTSCPPANTWTICCPETVGVGAAAVEDAVVGAGPGLPY